MPYVERDARKRIRFEERSPRNIGELNYAITALCHEYLSDYGIYYANLNAVIGVLECAKLELYRRIAAPYENIKIKENGDIGILEKKEDENE